MTIMIDGELQNDEYIERLKQKMERNRGSFSSNRLTSTIGKGFASSEEDIKTTRRKFNSHKPKYNE